MIYRIEFRPSAKKSFASLEAQERRKIGETIARLAENPRPHGCKKLQGSEEYRVRIGDYRVVYEIHDRVLLVLVLRIANRREAYR